MTCGGSVVFSGVAMKMTAMFKKLITIIEITKNYLCTTWHWIKKRSQNIHSSYICVYNLTLTLLLELGCHFHCYSREHHRSSACHWQILLDMVTVKCTLITSRFHLGFYFHVFICFFHGFLKSSWSWSWIYNYLCNQCLSPLTL
jgi:hypothetical protein